LSTLPPKRSTMPSIRAKNRASGERWRISERREA